MNVKFSWKAYLPLIIFVVYTILLVILWSQLDLKEWLLDLEDKTIAWYWALGFVILYLVRGVFFYFHITGLSLDLPNYISGYLKLPFIPFMVVVFLSNLITTVAYFVLFYHGLLPIVI